MIIVLLADGFEEIEALTPVDMLRRAGLEVKTVGVSGKTVTGAHGIPVICDASPEDIDLSEVHMVILPGGMPGTKNLDSNSFTDRAIGAVLATGGRIAAICAAPMILGKRGLLKNKVATCYPGFEKEIIDAIYSDKSVVTDGNITTARGMGTALEFAEELLTLTVGAKRAAEISAAICKPVKANADTQRNMLFGNSVFSIISESEDEEIPTVQDEQPDFSDYTAPSLDLLADDEPINEDRVNDYIKNITDKINEFFFSMNVAACVTGVKVGPRVTKVSVVPKKGTPVKKIIELDDDLLLCLGLSGIRMDLPIPGTSEIGIEFPNAQEVRVNLRPLLESKEFTESESPTTVCLGRDSAGSPIIADIAKMPHLLIGGAVSSGKTCLINSIITSILYKANPNDVKLVIVDPKDSEFPVYNGIPHLITPVISDPKRAIGALMWAHDEMERRYSLLSKLGARNVDAYNQKISEDSSLGQHMPKIVFIIDELADLILASKNPAESYVMRIAQKARAAGIYLIISTCRTTPNVITGVIKANIPSIACFKVVSSSESQTMLDYRGAEKLLGKGDALYQSPAQSKPIRMQGAIVSDAELDGIIDAAKRIGDGIGYDPAVAAYIDKKTLEIAEKYCPAKSVDDNEEEGGYLNDQRFLETVELAISTGKVSTALIQRKLSIGYGKAAKFIDIMENMGIVSEMNGQRPRSVLISMEDWKAMLARIK
ncbi:MAG: DJ-1/PfpI family protein [Clostridia bacterium]|nr:DJ-1/PfpI family protein [Clostridia bacterium]